jgi:hypothetical protein
VLASAMDTCKRTWCGLLDGSSWVSARTSIVYFIFAVALEFSQFTTLPPDYLVYFLFPYENYHSSEALIWLLNAI